MEIRRIDERGLEVPVIGFACNDLGEIVRVRGAERISGG